MRQMQFLHVESSRSVCIADVAETFVSRLVGLQGRRKLKQDGGMWIVPTRNIHTFGMRFAIDAVALDDHLQVVGLCAGLQPWRVGVFRGKPSSILELPVGRVREVGLRTGHTLRVEPCCAA